MNGSAPAREVASEAADADAPKPPSTWQTVEATASVFFAFVVGFCLAVAGGSILFVIDEPDAKWLQAVSFVTLLGEGAFLLWLKHALERGDLRPFVPRFALRQLHWPLILRPVVACWWLAHLVVALAFLVMLERLTRTPERIDAAAVAGYAVLGLASWTAAHCGQLYLLLAVASVWRHERIVLLLWHYRLAIDLAFTGAVIAVARAW